MTERQIRCTVTRYSLRSHEGGPLELYEDEREETTGCHVAFGAIVTNYVDGKAVVSTDWGCTDVWLYLHNSAASARLADLFAAAHEGRGWSAQFGTPPIFVDGRWHTGHVYPRIYVSAETLLELEPLIKDATPEGP